MKRAAGVLVNVSSFPGEFGVGGFSKEGAAVITVLEECGFKWWQVLPITTIGAGNSPYSGVSAFAGNYLYINPYTLLSDGLITNDELSRARYGGQPYQADYEFAKRAIRGVLDAAYSRARDGLKDEIAAFADENAAWLDDYAAYMTATELFGGDRRNWDVGLKRHDEEAVAAFVASNRDRYGFYLFEQYEFFRQWKKLKDYANERGIKILGDLPFYVAADSADVWGNQSLFKLSADGSVDETAGVPPDYFAEDGQLWGNPVFDFDKMAEDGFKWWRRRITHNLKLYDGLRLDHFRAFAEYYSVPIPKSGEKPSARDGFWNDGPGMKLLSLVKSDNPNAFLIAEDLGVIDEKVSELVKASGFPSMKVLQFAFESFDSIHLPHKFDKNTVAYTGTHDNNTTLGWLYDAKPDVRDYAFRYVGYDGKAWGAGGRDCPSTRALIRALISSVADLAVIPIQDLAGYGGDTRMNVPGIPEGNWRFRVHYDMLGEIDRAYFLGLNNLYGRNIK
ncbi:MAG: 4-alpha-glucanotransferase [Clostridiales bacterium]|jgi:4-alpha-glucanotransferase|nr:4-alpha-glucanotransferase [Clostridiales bacterium]